MSIELVLIILMVVVLITTVARVAQVGRRSGGRGWLRRGLNESPLTWAVRAVTGRLHDEPDLPEPAPGEINPLDRLAALMGDGGPGEEPHERHDATTSPALAPAPIPEPYAPPAPYVPQAPYAPPVVARPVPMPLAAAVAREPEPVSILQQTRAQRPLPAAAMAVQGGATASSSLGDVGTRSTGWMADLVKLSAASDAALERPASRRRRLYRDAAVVLLAASIVVLGAVALGPGIFNGIGGPGATPTPSLIAVVPTLSPSVTAIITPSPSPSPTPTPTPSPSVSPTPTLSPSPSPSPTPTPSPTPKQTVKPTPTPPPPTPTPRPVPKPVAAIFVSYNTTACGPNLAVTFDGSASTHASSYHWVFSGGGTSTHTGGNHNYIHAAWAPGVTTTFKITLTVTNASGSNTKSVLITPQCP